MSTYLFGKQLPKLYSEVPAFTEIASYIQRAKILFSSLFIDDGQQLYILNKENHVYIQTDWQAYSLIRATARLMLTTGSSLRAEPDVYLSRQSYGDENINQLYNIFQKDQRQKVIVFSKLLKKDDLSKYIEPSLYELIDLPKFDSLTELMSQIKKGEDSPVVVQFGMKLMKEYFIQVSNGSKNEIDTVLLSKYRGPFEEKFKGLPLSFPINQYYSLKWKSEKLPCRLTNQLADGELQFQIYTKNN